ncbi:MAG TPA: DUF4124 domain-containing protein [Casimicrobiaceae bacterium]|nr:DUF4124 domain-containing protein [Casimicrobiaceae bacterium]
MNRNAHYPTHRRHARATLRVAAPDLARRRVHGAVLLLAALALAFAALRDAHAGTYKWTDEKGVVHYADKMPADAVNRASTQLNAQGMTYKHTEAALTPEQIQAKYGDAEKQRQALRDKEIAQRRDNALVASYTKEQDIDLARARAINTIDGQLQSARVYVGQLTKRQQDLVERKIAAGAKGAPPAVERELESIDRELAKTNEFIAFKNDESLAVAAKYDADMQRWRELVTSAKTEAAREKAGSIPAAQVGNTTTTSVLPTSAAPR